jgi:hypothetical protein
MKKRHIPCPQRHHCCRRGGRLGSTKLITLGARIFPTPRGVPIWSGQVRSGQVRSGQFRPVVQPHGSPFPWVTRYGRLSNKPLPQERLSHNFALSKKTVRQNQKQKNKNKNHSESSKCRTIFHRRKRYKKRLVFLFLMENFLSAHSRWRCNTPIHTTNQQLVLNTILVMHRWQGPIKWSLTSLNCFPSSPSNKD